LDLSRIKVYRLGPIAAFDRSAHSVSQYPVGDYLFQPLKKLEKKERYLLGYLGSLLPEKGLGFLFRALKELPQFDLLVVGGNE